MVSIVAKMLMKQLEKNKSHILDMETIDEFRGTFDNMTARFKPAKGVNLEEIQIGNIAAENTR